MNNNESYNISRRKPADLSDDGCAEMTEEELLLYREVLNAAYPKPKRDIKAGVMTAVRRDAALKRKRAQIFSRSSVMRWGGLAASIVLVAAIGIRVLPSFLTQDNLVTTADSAAAEQAETLSGVSTFSTFQDRSAKKSSDITENAPAEDAADGSTDSYGENTAGSVDADAPAEIMLSAFSSPEAEEAVSDEAEEIEEAVLEEPAAEFVIEEAVAEAVAEEAVIEEAPVAEETGSTAVKCTHKGVFADSYHVIPRELVDHVGGDNYLLWLDEIDASFGSCSENIRAFIDRFGMTADEFAYYLTTTDLAYCYDYPLDILFGTAEECENYYSGGGNYERMLADHFEYSLKLALAEEIGTDAYEAWLDEFPYRTVRAWSISEFVTDHDIPEPRFCEIYDEAADAFMKEYNIDSVHEYDTMKLYVSTAGIKIALASSQLGYNADVSCRK